MLDERGYVMRPARAVLYLIEQAANAGKICPTNQELADGVGFESPHSASGSISHLRNNGEITVKGQGHRRVITIVASGLKTADRCDDVRRVIAEAADLWRVRTADIYGPAQNRPYMLPRQAAYYVARQRGHAITVIADVLARDHSTIASGIRRAGEWLKRDDLFALRLGELERRVAV